MIFYLLTKFRLFFVLIFCLVCLGHSPQAFAQEDERDVQVAFSLEDCLRYAYDNLEALKKQQLTVKATNAQVKEYVSVGLPQISAQAQITNNSIIQRQILPDGTLFGGPPGPIAVQFQPLFLSQASVNISQMIYDPSYPIGLKGVRLYRDLTERQAEFAKVDVAESVAKTYYLVLISKERIKLIDQNISRLDTLFRETKELFATGFVEQIDVDRTEVSLNNLKIERESTIQVIETTLQLLKFQMGMPVNNPISLRDDLSKIKIDSTWLAFSETNYTDRQEYDLLMRQRGLLEVDLKNKRAVGTIPSLRAFGSLGMNSGGSFSQITNRNRWFEFAFVGLSLNVPITNGGKTSALVQKARIELDKNQLDLQTLERTFDFQVQQAYTKLKNSLALLEARKRNMQLAKEVTRVAKIKYENGIGSNLEIITAETTFKEAELNYQLTMYDAIVARIELEKALGTLVK